MSNDVSNERRDAVRAKAKKVSARIRRRKVARRALITIVVIAAVGAAGWWVWKTVTPELDRPVVEPKNLTGDGVDILSTIPEDERPDMVEDPIAIDIYYDYMAPDAGVIEQSLAPQIYELLDEGVVTVSYHPLSLMPNESNGSQYSTRAAAAAMCVVSEHPEAFRAFNTALLTAQPEIGTEGPTDEELAATASDAGAPGLDECISDHVYAPWIGEATTRATAADLPDTDGIRVTAPIVLADHQLYEGGLDDPADFSQFLLTLQSEQYYGGIDKGDSE
jgi:protein-disulfide isomerase